MVSEQDVRKALVAVIDPEIRRSVVELDMVRGIAIDGGRVDVTIALTVAGCPMKANLEQQVQQHVGAVAWRGPMLHRALEQFLSDVHWGELDYLVVDMPPGTGDISISLGQLLPQPDLLIVTTPQAAAQKVAMRAADVAAKTGMRVAGVVENMSHLVCSCCGEVTRPFGEGGGRALADQLGVP